MGGDGQSGVVRQKRLPRAERERQMLDAAVRVFGKRGYRAASMDEIAELAGVSKPLVYLYLNSKEDLFSACVRREAQALVDAVRAGVRTDVAADRQLWEGLTAFFAHTAERPDGWAVLHSQALPGGAPSPGSELRTSGGDAVAAEVVAMREEIVAFVTGLIAEAAREAHDNPELAEREVVGLAQALVGAAEALAGWANGDASVSAKEAATTMMNFAWSGLGNLMAGERWSAR